MELGGEGFTKSHAESLYSLIYGLRFGVASDQLSAQPHSSSNSEKRKLHTTLNNICTVLTLSRIELGTPKSLNIQSEMSTFPPYQRGSQENTSEFSANLNYMEQIFKN